MPHDRSVAVAAAIFAAGVLLSACGDRAAPPAPPEQAAGPMGGGMGPGGPGGPGGPVEPQTLEAFQARIAVGFDGLDADGDGVVTTAELNGASGGRASPMLARLDADGDGRITRAEMDAGARRLFSRMDPNGDGVATADERPGFGRGGPMGPPPQG